MLLIQYSVCHVWLVRTFLQLDVNSGKMKQKEEGKEIEVTQVAVTKSLELQRKLGKHPSSLPDEHLIRSRGL